MPRHHVWPNITAPVIVTLSIQISLKLPGCRACIARERRHAESLPQIAGSNLFVDAVRPATEAVRVAVEISKC